MTHSRALGTSQVDGGERTGTRADLAQAVVLGGDQRRRLAAALEDAFSLD